MIWNCSLKIQVYFHDFGKDNGNDPPSRMYVDSGKLPLMTITEGQCQGILCSSWILRGYGRYVGEDF